MKKSTNIEEFECMEYICDKIILIIKYENLNKYFKTIVVNGIIGWFFYARGYWYTSLNLGQFINLKFWDEIPLKKYGFLHLFNNECIIISF